MAARSVRDGIARGTGGRVIYHFVLRPGGRVETDFVPFWDVFRFGNHWDSAPCTPPPLRESLPGQNHGKAVNGLYGGMVFAALDHLNAEVEISAVAVAPLGEQDPAAVRRGPRP
jgi:hypothetical protein